jgi:hypothetical protein
MRSNGENAYESDFTLDSYGELLELAKSRYSFVQYPGIGSRHAAGEDWQGLLWRHDCDMSLNRALRLAQVENAHSVRATYFLLPHSEFYNLLEKEQVRLVERIRALGHDIGLHFDADFHEVASESALDDLVGREARWLGELLGTQLQAFSFHNPSALMLSCERESYGGLINCYSKMFKTRVAYCSDSNGHWRFKRLRDVIDAAASPRLQVLTHAEWWQESAMPARARVARCAYGRADRAMRTYDAILAGAGRENLGGPSESLRFLAALDPDRFRLCDYLWNQNELASLLIELHRLQGAQVRRLCSVMLVEAWQVPQSEVTAFFDSRPAALDDPALFEKVFEQSWAHASGSSDAEYRASVALRDRLVRGDGDVAAPQLEQACVSMCRIIENLARWGVSSDARYDGIGSHQSRVGRHRSAATDRWRALSGRT